MFVFNEFFEGKWMFALNSKSCKTSQSVHFFPSSSSCAHMYKSEILKKVFMAQNTFK